jgi:hypothetical protein
MWESVERDIDRLEGEEDADEDFLLSSGTEISTTTRSSKRLPRSRSPNSMGCRAGNSGSSFRFNSNASAVERSLHRCRSLLRGSCWDIQESRRKRLSRPLGSDCSTKDFRIARKFSKSLRADGRGFGRLLSFLSWSQLEDEEPSLLPHRVARNGRNEDRTDTSPRLTPVGRDRRKPPGCKLPR